MKLVDKGAGQRIPYVIETNLYKSTKEISTYVKMDVEHHLVEEIEATLKEIKSKVIVMEKLARGILKGLT